MTPIAEWSKVATVEGQPLIASVGHHVVDTGRWAPAEGTGRPRAEYLIPEPTRRPPAGVPVDLAAIPMSVQLVDLSMSFTATAADGRVGAAGKSAGTRELVGHLHHHAGQVLAVQEHLVSLIPTVAKEPDIVGPQDGGRDNAEPAIVEQVESCPAPLEVQQSLDDGPVGHKAAPEGDEARRCCHRSSVAACPTGTCRVVRPAQGTDLLWGRFGGLKPLHLLQGPYSLTISHFLKPLHDPVVAVPELAI
jgi:hypothetical protein